MNKKSICSRGMKTGKSTAGTDATSMFWLVCQMLAVSDMASLLMGKLVGSCQHKCMRYSQKKNTFVEIMQYCMSVVVLTVLVLILAMPSHISHRFSCSSWSFLLALSSLWVSLASAICMWILYAISSMMAQQWFLGHRVQWAGWRGFLGTSERRCRPNKKNRFLISSQANHNAPEVHEKQLGSSSSTERPPGQTLGSWVCGADGAGNEGRRVLCRLVVAFGQCVEIPEASRFLPGARAGPALLFGRIQRRENATDGSGRRHPGASDSGSQRASGGHQSPGAGREGRKTVEFSGRAVARVLESVRVVCIRGSADFPSHGRSREHVDDPTERRGRKGERRVFARSGLKSIGILFLTSPKKRTQMRE